MGRQDPGNTGPPDERARELRRAFAVVFHDLATGLRGLGDLVGSADVDASGTAYDQVAEVVAETRAVVTELALIDVNPRVDTTLWMLQGSVLAAVAEILDQLDLEREANPAAVGSRP